MITGFVEIGVELWNIDMTVTRIAMLEISLKAENIRSVRLAARWRYVVSQMCFKQYLSAYCKGMF